MSDQMFVVTLHVEGETPRTIRVTQPWQTAQSVTRTADAWYDANAAAYAGLQLMRLPLAVTVDVVREAVSMRTYTRGDTRAIQC